MLNVKNGNLKCNLDVFTWNKSDKTMFNEKLAELLGIEQRLPEEKIEAAHENLAAAVQQVYEEILFEIIKTICETNKERNLCLSGGCARA